MDPRRFFEIQSRRDFFRRYGIGTAALAHLMADEGRAAETASDPLIPKPPHFAPKAKNVVFLFSVGSSVSSYFWSLGGWPACVALFATVQVLTIYITTF